MPAKRLIGAVGGVAISALIAIFLHPAGMEMQGTLVLAILAGAIVWWICDVLPEFATALLMVVLFVSVAGISPEAAFSMFSNSTWWILVGAFAIGLGMRQTGLLRRMAFGIVSLFPRSFAAQVAGFIACGTLLGPLIPSMSAKVSLLGPLAMEIGDALDYPRQGRQDTGLFLAMFTGVQNVAPAVLSASVIGYALLALYPAEVQAQFDFLGWLVASLPWFLPFTIANFVMIVLFYRKQDPEGKGASVSVTDTAASPSLGPDEDAMHPSSNQGEEKGAASMHGRADEESEERMGLGPMSVAEKLMATVAILTILLWITQGVHGLAAWIPAVCALVAMVAAGIITKSNLSTGMDWSSLVFIGIVLGLGAVFAEAGLNSWIVSSFGPAVSELASQPYLLVAGVALITISARFLVVSQIAFLNIFMAFAIPIALAHGVNPWIIGMACYAVISPWFVKYQNPVYLAAYYSVDGKMAKHSALAAYCIPYTVASIACLMLAVPIWQMMGLL